jgi:hypothetical protein
VARKVNWTYNHDESDQLIAVENAMSYITDAMDEMEGIGELFDHYNALKDALDELETKKDELENYMTGEYQAMIAEQTRDYYRSVI